MVNKQSVSVVITTKAGFSVTADDAVKAGQGTSAYGALDNGRDVRVSNAAGTEITYVPNCAIDHAIVTFTMSQEAEPQDDTCPAPQP